MKEFLANIEALRESAREEIDHGPLLDPSGADHQRLIFVLNQELAVNVVCAVNHMRHFVTADRLHARSAAAEFLEHTVQESEHSDLLVARIQQLGGEADVSRDRIVSRSRVEFNSPRDLEALIREDLVAENIAIAAYADSIAWLADVDPLSARLLEQVLSLEEEHAAVMLGLVAVANN